ncbi:hypothetical protein SAMN05518848_102716 [Paenibacillus sp. PDC88]|nr:hypothetical protein SAMN05518848_102716 [Paenibacillus sp. PDC88]
MNINLNPQKNSACLDDRHVFIQALFYRIYIGKAIRTGLMNSLY